MLIFFGGKLVGANFYAFCNYTHICHFFTQAKFLENKIYTEIYTVNCQFSAFNLKKITPTKKNLHGRRPWRPWQISGMVFQCQAKPQWHCTFMHCSATHSFCCNLHCSVTQISYRSPRWHCTFECNSCDSVDLSGCCHADLLWRCDVTAFRHNRFVLSENTCGWKILIYLAENWLLITNAE